jgi:galactose mutarotase-like enzyme
LDGKTHKLEANEGNHTIHGGGVSADLSTQQQQQQWQQPSKRAAAAATILLLWKVQVALAATLALA